MLTAESLRGELTDLWLDRSTRRFDWGRYAELFGFDDDAGEVFLETSE